MQQKFAGQGCAGGALIGAGAGAALDGRRGALIGGVAGCLAGAFVGFYFAERKEAYANQQEAVVAEIKWNQKTANKVQRSNQELAQNIQKYQQHIQRIQAMQMNQKQRQNILSENNKHFQDHFDGARRILAQLQKELATSNLRYTQYQATSNPAELQAWQGKIAALEQEKSILEANVNTLNAMNNSLGI